MKKVETPTTRRLTLQNLLAENQEIWVRNKSGQVTKKQAGNIVMQVGSGMTIDVVTVPPGNDPVCLTEQVTPKLLAECMDLFKLVRTGALELLDPKQADAYYKQNKDRKIIMEKKIQSLLSKERTPLTRKQKLNQMDPEKKVHEADMPINQKVGDICLKSKHANITEQEALERLMEQEAVLNMEDYSYLSTRGVYNGVKRWAKDQMSKLAELEEDPVEATLK